MDVELPHIADNDDVRLRHTAGNEYEAHPASRDRCYKQWQTPRLAQYRYPTGSRDLKRYVTLLNLHAMGAQAIDHHLNPGVRLGIVSTEECYRQKMSRLVLTCQLLNYNKDLLAFAALKPLSLRVWTK